MRTSRNLATLGVLTLTLGLGACAEDATPEEATAANSQALEGYPSCTVVDGSVAGPLHGQYQGGGPDQGRPIVYFKAIGEDTQQSGADCIRACRDWAVASDGITHSWVGQWPFDGRTTRILCMNYAFTD